ncbi:S1 family peptidase [Pseudarthrobacter sp. MDT3-26]|uniref:S1 family peptidase n=1 Tax=Pseudarthrobacter raffinosi TaxID=2953651 RepID=UPI00208F94D8|nr:S1 family peptidase [Pseudarthrobacter sp. MDT3-26]MCO4263147.1 S1 family peptidase [Pseudarthrobacter sp. MDT3-26]
MAHSLKRVFAVAAAAGVALSVGLGAVPAWAVEQPAVEPPPVASPAVASADAAERPTAGGSGGGDAQPGEVGPGDAHPGDAGLREAALRDVGLTADEFAAAGQLGKQAADVAAALQDISGYLGTRIHNGSILVAGSGAELEAEVARLSATIPAVDLETAPAAPPSDGPADRTDAPAATGTQSTGSPATGTELARSTQELYQAYLRDVGAAGLQAVAYTGSRFVVRTGGINGSEATVPDSADDGNAGSSLTSPNSDGKISPAEFVARYANVQLDAGAPLAPQADLSGGQGYFTDIGEICSAGFSVFDPAGLPGVLTAGHCTDDGAAATATVEFPQWNRSDLLGTFGFSQFGGPGNSTVLRPGNDDDPGNVGTDIAVIGQLRAGLDPLPAASTWNDPSQAGRDVKIIGTAAPVIGMPVCRSGRTSAWSCGTIDEVGIYVAGGLNYATDPTDLRAFNGFLSFDVQSSGGDSGGPWVSGNYAVGTHSAGEEAPKPNEAPPVNFAVAATLQDSLTVLPGYQLELFLNKPAVTSPASGATFDAGQTVTGTVAAAPASAVAAGSKVRITVSGQASIEVPVDAGGAWSFTAPAVAGPLRFTAETVNGFSTSGAVAFDFTPVSQPSQPAPQSQPPAAVPAANGALPPKRDSAAVVRPLGDSAAAGLANTGASGLILFAGLAAGALAVGGVLLVLAKRRKRQRPTPTR